MDRLLLLLSIDYPSTPSIISNVLEINNEDAKDLFDRAKAYTFIKTVGSDDSIVLHDEMRRLINEYVWPVLDEQDIRAKHYRTKVIGYLDREIEKIHKEKTTIQDDDFFLIEELRHKEWMLQRRRLMHYLNMEPEKGVSEFCNLYDDVADDEKISFREVLVSQLDRDLVLGFKS